MLQFFLKGENIMKMNNSGKANSDVMEFFIGLTMLVVGGYLFMKNVMVTTENFFYFRPFGMQLDGLIFVPLIASIIFLFYKYNMVSKICCGLSLAIILINVIANLRLRWMTTSLFATIVIFVLLFGGLGLVLRNLFANADSDHGKNYKK